MDYQAETVQSAEVLGALQALTDGIAIFDAQDTLVFFNQRFRDLNRGLGHLLQLGLPWPILRSEMAQRDLGRALDQLERRLDLEAEMHQSLDAPWPGDRWMRLGLSLTRSGGFVLTLTDITESVEATELRAEADDLLRKVLDACSANLMMTRIADGKILYRNPASAQLFGRRATARDVFEDASDRPDMLAELLATGAVDAFETTLLRGDDTPFPGQVSARMVEYGGEEVIVSSATDMTQLHAQRDELARQREASFQNEKLTALGELLAGVAHELNNPLSVVVGQALMLKEETEESDVLRRVDKISQSAERCAKIVKTFLAMARQKPARLEPVSMNTIVETAVDVAGYGIRKAGGALLIDLADDLPLAKADEDQIAQVLVNLLVNAEQATAEGATRPQVAIRSWADVDAHQVKVSVSDNGPGIAPAARARIFEPFFTTKKDGAGVGLALCHRIVAGHDGGLSVGPARSGGAEFTLALPIADTPGATQDRRAHPVAPALHALVVDDEADVAEMLSDMLDTLGVRSTIAHSAEDAIDALNEGLSPNLVLSDFVMPGLGGEGLLRAVRRDWPQLSRRLAFVTGDSLNSDARRLGLPVLEKPVAPHDLRNLLRDLID